VWRPVAFGRTPWYHFRPGVVLASALYGAGDGARSVDIVSKTTSPTSISSHSRLLVDTGGVLSRVNGEYVSGYRFGHVAFS
jgi:hypothetical protein